MKLLSLSALFLLLIIEQKQPIEIKLEGKYRMEYEADYAAENCNIKIKGEEYVKTYRNGPKRKGKIETLQRKFGKLYTLKDKDSNLEVDVDGRTYKVSDTIYFRTKKVDEKNKDGLTIYSGKLIKIK